VLLVVALLAAACGGKSDSGEKKSEDIRLTKGESGLEEAGDPVRGGRLVYGLEAETTGGWCLTDSQLAISGNLVRSAIYDTLTTYDSEGTPVPYLAESVESNADHTVWTITLRDGVTFHDDSPLDAEVVKNNLDAFLGRFPPRTSSLWSFVLANVESVEATDPRTVEVTMAKPWVAFPATLTGLGIMGMGQLTDPDNCDRNLIGTGPFELSSWRSGVELVAQRNAHYWQIAPDGQPYPYVDAVAFRPIPDAQQRINALDSGEVNMLITSTPADITGGLMDLRDEGRINLLVSEAHAEVNYIMLNSRQAPFDDLRMRRATAMGIDREEVNELANDGFPTVADQPFAPGDMGYVEDPGFPSFDPKGAKALVDELRREGKETSFDLTVTTEPAVLARAEVIQNQLKDVGIEMNIRSAEQSALISEALDGKYQGMTFRGFPGPEPDTKYVAWYPGSPVNLTRMEDPEIAAAMDEGRAEPDPAKRKEIYERISEQFAEQVWDIWLNYTPWAVAESSDVHGVQTAVLPGGEKPFTGLAAGHFTHAMWIDEG
jgi:peptide/nickel transport system substrate-binding protein